MSSVFSCQNPFASLYSNEARPSSANSSASTDSMMSESSSPMPSQDWARSRGLSIQSDESYLDSAPLTREIQCLNPQFDAISQGINQGNGSFDARALPRSKSLNEIFLIHAASSLPVALFKPNTTQHGSDRSMGLAGTPENAPRNEIVAARVSRVLTPVQIVPDAEIASLRLGTVDSIRSIGESSIYISSLSDERSLVEGTLHKFIADSVSLKSSGGTSSPFFNSMDPTIQHATRMIAVLHILLCYLDGHMDNVLIDKMGSPTAVDFGDIIPSRFEVGARPPFWLNSIACNSQFSAEDVVMIKKLSWESIRVILDEVGGYTSEKIITMQLCYVLLQTGVDKGLTPSQIMCFLLGKFPSAFSSGAPRLPSAMHLVYKACVKDGEVDREILGLILAQSMDFLLKESKEIPEGVDGRVYFEAVGSDLLGVIQLVSLGK